jgi:soluble lytic murein transglycosylase-like protein
MAQKGGLEDAVGQRWLAAQNEEAGTAAASDTVQQAVEKYGIEESLASDIVEAAQKNGIDPKMALGLVKTESTFNHRAVSHVGARGLTQVMPKTARWLRPGTKADDLFDRKINLDLGFSYLRDLLDKYDGNEQLALTAYNRGPGTVDRILKRGGNPDNGYAGKVLRG